MLTLVPENENVRLAAVAKYGIVDSVPERAYDEIVALASQLCATPMAAIAFVDDSRWWIKAAVGIESGISRRDLSFCAQTILEPDGVLVVSDASTDPRFADAPAVTGRGGVRFYAGVPIIGREGLPLGTLSVMDTRPRRLPAGAISDLRTLAHQAGLRVAARLTAELLERAIEEAGSLTLRDTQTGLWNRRGFLLHAEHLIRSYRERARDGGLWVLAAEIDGFDDLDRNFGRVRSDEAVSAAAEILLSSLGPSDIVSRFTDDGRFHSLVLDADERYIETAIGRVTAAVERFNYTGGQPFILRLRVGGVRADDGGEHTINELIAAAENSMGPVNRLRTGS